MLLQIDYYDALDLFDIEITTLLSVELLKSFVTIFLLQFDLFRIV